jgi:hypothetical protein
MNDIISNPTIISSPNIVSPIVNETSEILTKTTKNLDLKTLNNVTDITKNKLNESLETVKSINYLNILKYVSIIILLSLLGFNLFKNLGVLVDKIDVAIKYVLSLFGYELVSKPLQSSVVGVNQNTEEIKDENVDMKKVDEDTKMNNTNSLDNILNTTEEKLNIENSQSNNENNVFKSGFCYVGEDRGYRTCVQVGQADKCMSGDIFPSKDVCINPNLRV